MANESAGPSVSIYVGSVQLSHEVTGHITHIEADLARDIADQITLTLLNPVKTLMGVGNAQNEFAYVDSSAFQPGNEITVFMGYGGINEYIARGIITKYLPQFPSDGIPKLTIKATDASVLMMESEAGMLGSTWPDMSYSDIVGQLTAIYGFSVGEIEQTPSLKNTVKKAGISDYKFIKGLANLVGFEFKIRWEQQFNSWRVYWRKPKAEQDRKYTFTYLNGQESTLLSFEPQFGLRDVATEVKVLYFDQLTRTWEEMSVKEDKAGEGRTFTGNERMKQEITSGSAIRIDAAGTSIEVIPERPFSSPEDAYRFAQKWLKARKDNFIMGEGKTIGVETLRPGQVHYLTGLGKQLSGDYELTTVRHIFDRDKGYLCEIFGNKVLK